MRKFQLSRMGAQMWCGGVASIAILAVIVIMASFGNDDAGEVGGGGNGAIGQIRIDIRNLNVEGNPNDAETVALNLREFVRILYGAPSSFSQNVAEISSHAAMMLELQGAEGQEVERYKATEVSLLKELVEWYDKEVGQEQLGGRLQQLRTIYPSREIASSRLNSLENISALLSLYGDVAKMNRDTAAAAKSVDGNQQLAIPLIVEGRPVTLLVGVAPHEYENMLSLSRDSIDAFVLSLIEQEKIILHDGVLRKQVVEYLESAIQARKMEGQ